MNRLIILVGEILGILEMLLVIRDCNFVEIEACFSPSFF